MRRREVDNCKRRQGANGRERLVTRLAVLSGLAPPPLADEGRLGYMAGPHSWADEMQCVKCGSEAVTERPERTAQGYGRFRCRGCGKQFNERTGGLLNRTQYPSDVIALVVLWRLRYKLSLRDLPEMFALRGLVFSHEAVREWEAKLTPALAEDRRRRGKAGRSWCVDETYIKVQGRWCYLYRAIDRSGALVDVLFSEHRDMAAAKAFFRSEGGDRHHPRPGHDRRPRQLPAGDPDRAGSRCAAPDQPLQEQRAGTGSPRSQGPLPAHAGFRVPPIGRPVLPGLRRAPQLPPPPLPPQPARPRRPPSTAPAPQDHDRAGHPRSGLIGPRRRSEDKHHTRWREA